MPNKALRTLYLYNGIFVLAGSLFGPLYAIYVENIGGGVIVVSMSWALFLISSTLFTFIVSKFGDTVKEKEYLLLLGFLVRAVVWILYIFVGNVYALAGLQILLGLGEALGSPTFDSLVAEHLDKGRHIEEYSDMKIIFNLSAGIAAVLGGVVVAKFGFTYLFIAMSALALFSTLGILLKPRRLL
jgi:MFS family permease